MLTKDKLKYFNERLISIREETQIVAFPEIIISDDQLAIMAEPMFSWTKDELKNYYKAKIQGEILITQTPYTTREDQPDFQYLFDLGVKALSLGMEL